MNYLYEPSMSTVGQRLEYLKMITKNGRNVNKALKSKIFLVMIDLIDADRIADDMYRGNFEYEQIIEFIKNLMD